MDGKLPELGDCNMFSSRQAARFITQIYDRHLVKAKITSGQFSIFLALRGQHGVTLGELARKLAIDRTSLLRAIKLPIRQGFICEWRSLEHPKKASFGLTPDGLVHFEQALPYWLAAQQEFESLFGADNASRLRRDLLLATKLHGYPSSGSPTAAI